MPTLTVSEIGQTKSGRATVRCGKDKFYCGNGVPVPPVGATILADTSDGSFDGEGGKRVTMWYLNKWEPAAGQQSAPQAMQANPTTYAPAHPQPAPVASAAAVGLPMEPGDVLRFISNVVGQAISAKTIADPMDITAWAAEALSVARKLRDGSLRVPEPAIKPPPAGQTNDRYPMNDAISEKDIGF